eukprot:COSAG04_NODE_1086_length_8365_cov_94.900919_2_plen_67_part_00
MSEFKYSAYTHDHRSASVEHWVCRPLATLLAEENRPRKGLVRVVLIHGLIKLCRCQALVCKHKHHA